MPAGLKTKRRYLAAAMVLGSFGLALTASHTRAGDVDKGRELEARLAFLAGLTEESADLAISFNVELKL